MPSVTRVDPKTIFTPDEWARISKQSVFMGPLLVACAWAVIIGAGALFIWMPNPITYVLAVMLIGTRQLGLAILEHEAAHGTLHPNAKFNDWLAEWLCGAAVGGSLKRYRPYHLTHHKYTEQAEDPDLVLSRPFPVTRGSIARKFVRDLTGQTFYKLRIAPFIEKVKGKQRKPPRVPDTPGLRFWIVNGVMIVATSALGYWWAWPALWIVPMATWFPLVTRLRSMAEHAMVNTQDDPFTHARTTIANPLERLFIAPFWVHYHCEHHCFMYVPCYNLEKAHKLLLGKGFRERMRITKGYVEVLRRCGSKETPKVAAAA
jgi:fatty acid desaturase